MWAISTRESDRLLEQFRDGYDIGLPILSDTDGSVSDDYRMTMAYPTAAYPQQWLIDQTGQIVWFTNRYDHDALVEKIEALLRE